jgi:hypothetical protein
MNLFIRRGRNRGKKNKLILSPPPIKDVPSPKKDPIVTMET